MPTPTPPKFSNKPILRLPARLQCFRLADPCIEGTTKGSKCCEMNATRLPQNS